MRVNALIYGLLLLVVSGQAQPRFTYADMAAGKLAVRSIAGLRPTPDGDHYTVRQEGRIVSYRYDSPMSEVIFDGKVAFAEYQISPDGQKILLATAVKPIYRHSFSADYMVYDRTRGTLTPLTKEGGEQQALFSPDSRKVGFVRGNDLWVTSLDDFSARRITTDGERGSIINGLPDWVYEEEYGFSRAFHFSPDSRRIAWLRTDEGAVEQFTFMTFNGELYPKPYTYKYPKAGCTNSSVEVLSADLATGKTERTGVDFTGLYVPRFGFTPEGELWMVTANRLQNHIRVIVCDQTPLVAYEEHADRYVERPDDQTVTFLPGGRMIVCSERTGWRHLYLYGRDGSGYALKNAITSGEWEVAGLVAAEDGRLWYTSHEGSPLRTALYSVKLDGRDKKRLTEGNGTVRVEPGAGMKYYVNFFSNAATPLQVSIHRGDGIKVRTLEDNAALRRYADSVRLPRREFFTLPAADGTPLNAWILKPVGFNPAKAHPVMMTQYSGPGSQEVKDAWKTDWEDALVQQGYVVVCVDPRGTGGRGRDFRQCTYSRLGEVETADQIAAARWIAAQPWADPARIGIYGWSFGGFMALNCILHGADVFKMAIAVAPVTSWRYYDSIYTETYNGLPQQNPDGYDGPSPLTHAAKLKGKLLMIHGSADDNVHIHNTYEMAAALTREGKQFDMAVYTDCNHSMLPHGRHHVRQRMVDYVLANL